MKTEYPVCPKCGGQRAVFPCLRKHGRHSGVANFGHVLSGIRESTGIDVIRRDMNTVDKAIRALPFKPTRAAADGEG